MTFWPPKTRYKKAWGAPALTSCTVPSLHAKACTHSINRSFQCNTYSIQKLMNTKNRRSMQTTTLWASLTNTNDMRIDNTSAHQLWTQTRSRSKQRCQAPHHNPRNPEKITNRSKWSGGHQIQGIRRAPGYSHTQPELWLPRTTWFRNISRHLISRMQ
jgi:hypothetical protein